MGGLAGLISTCVSNYRTRSEILRRWQGLLYHRGSGGWGWFSDEEQVLLFHNDVSVTNSTETPQPLPDEKKHIWILFTGYLCGNINMRRDLETTGHRFRTGLEAEVVIHLYEEHGIDAVGLLRGEFAFALYDSKIGKLYLVRDRFGVKPLYYSYSPGKSLCFGSEVKAIFAAGMIPRKLDINVLRNYLNAFSFADETLFEGIRQVKPGHVVCYDFFSGELVQTEYWRLPLGKTPMQGKDPDLIAEFRHLLVDAIKIRKPEDGKCGAFLSGGLDSSSVIALMCKGTPDPFPVFTLAYENSGYDESTIAADLADKFGLPHHVVTSGRGTLTEFFIRSVWHSETAVVNTHGAAKMLLSQTAGSLCKPVFSGEGADELLWGYHFFRHLINAESGNFKAGGHKISLLRGSMTGKLIHYEEVKKVFGAYPYLMMRHFYLNKFRNRILSDNFKESVQKEAWNWQSEIFKHIPEELMKGLTSPELSELFLLKCDFPSYLLNYLGDRQEMAMGVEGRTPFLDHHLAEFTCHLPGALKFRNNTGKYILREALREDLPDAVINREKQAFYAPAFMSIDYFNNREYFKPWIDKQAFRDAGIFNRVNFNILVGMIRILPSGHWLSPVLEGLVVFVLSMHILIDLYIRRFDYWSDYFSKPFTGEGIQVINTGIRYQVI